MKHQATTSHRTPMPSRPRTLRHTARVAALATMIAVPALHAATGSRNVDAAGSWGTGTNGTSVIPGGIDDVANFTNNISAARTITLDGTRTVGTLKIGDADSSAAFTLTAMPSSGSLIFDVSAGQAVLEISNGGAIGNVVTVPIILNDDLRIAITGSSTAAQTINGPISDGVGSRAIVIDSNGTHPAGTASTVGQVTLNGVNTFSGGLAIKQTRVTANNSFALGTGTVTVTDGGQHNNNFILTGLGWNETTHGQLGAIRPDSNNTLAGTITLAGANVRLAGTANTTLINGVIGESVAGANLDIGHWLPSGGAAAAATSA